jgi:ATP-dependent RNA helicase DDX43
MKEVSFLILDEADEMLDQGFEPQINKALMRVRSDRQTILTRYVLNYKVLIGTLNLFLFLSATWPESVRRMAKNYTKNPIMVVIGTVELKAVQSVKQNIVMLDETEKYEWVCFV